MGKNNFRSYIRSAHPVSQLFLLIAVTLFSAGLLSGLGLLVIETLYGAGLEQVQSYFADPSKPNAIPAIKVMQMFYSLGVFLLPAMVFSQLFSPQPLIYLRLTREIKPLTIAAIIVLFIAFIPITDALSWVNNAISFPSFMASFEAEMRSATENMQSLMGNFMQMDSFGAFLFNLVLMAVLPALGEEFFFRGILQRVLISRTGRVHLSVWVTGLAFALMHQQFFSLLPLVILGALLGYLKEWTGSLWASIMAHFVNNATIVVVMYFGNYNMSDTEVLTSPQWAYLLPAIAISAGLIFYLAKNQVEKQEEDDDLLPESDFEN